MRRKGRKVIKPAGSELMDYSLAVKGMDVSAVSNSASAGKALVELSNTIPNCGGLVSFFTGDNSIADFGDQLVLFGNGLAAYSASIEGILALLGREQIAEALSQVALKEIIGVVLIYGLKALFENLSKNNSWPDKGNSTPPEDGVG